MAAPVRPQPTPLLRSPQAFLRPLEPDEAGTLCEAVIESLDTVGLWMSWASPAYSPADARTWIANGSQERQAGLSHEFGIFSAADDRLVGVAGLNQFNTLNGFCNLGYWVRRSAQRQGFALAAVGLLRDYALRELQLNRLEIVVAEGNRPSAALAERAGACFEGIARSRLKLHGKPVDARMYAFVADGATARAGTAG